MPAQALTGRLARGLQLFLAAEAAGLLLTGLLLQRAGFGSIAIALALAGWFLGLRAVLVSRNFWLSESGKSPRRPEHQVDLRGAWRLWWGEYWFTVLTYSVLFPFERWLLPLAPATAAAGTGIPVVLVPGFACNRGYWWFLVRALRRAGIGPVHAVTLEPLFGSIDENASRLGAVVEEVCRATGQSRVHLVGHSMGGLVIRAWLHAGNAASVASVVTLGSPHHGTRIAHGVRTLGEDLRQMCLNDAWLVALNRNQVAACPVPITSIVSPHDNIVFPQDSAELRYPNARNVFLVGEGHLQMVRSPRVIQELLSALGATGAEGGRGGD